MVEACRTSKSFVLTSTSPTLTFILAVLVAISFNFDKALSCTISKVSILPSILVKLDSRATRSVWFALINEFREDSISPFLVKILLLICPNVSPEPSTFTDNLFWILFNLEAVKTDCASIVLQLESIASVSTNMAAKVVLV